jgi:hypothetical protein
MWLLPSVVSGDAMLGGRWLQCAWGYVVCSLRRCLAGSTHPVVAWERTKGTHVENKERLRPAPDLLVPIRFGSAEDQG